jgi:hypothetical protein
MSFKSVASKTCIWCIVGATVALSLLAFAWLVVLVSNQ